MPFYKLISWSLDFCLFHTLNVFYCVLYNCCWVSADTKLRVPTQNTATFIISCTSTVTRGRISIVLLQWPSLQAGSHGLCVCMVFFFRKKREGENYHYYIIVGILSEGGFSLSHRNSKADIVIAGGPPWPETLTHSQLTIVVWFIW